jgi:glucose-1-phosphatase
MLPKFIYFDLGKVLVDFSVEWMLGQVGAIAGISSQAARTAIFDGLLMRKHELGQISAAEFYDAFCTATKTRAPFEALAAAVGAIFDLMPGTLPLVAQLNQAGYPLGILSNTCELHWEYCTTHYQILSDAFRVHALSFRIGALKPEPAIFEAAARLAGIRPQEIFFVDDMPGHVAGAQAAGFDAVQFTTAAALAAELRQRGLRFNY